jgi:hypothetical protein
MLSKWLSIVGDAATRPWHSVEAEREILFLTQNAPNGIEMARWEVEMNLLPDKSWVGAGRNGAAKKDLTYFCSTFEQVDPRVILTIGISDRIRNAISRKGLKDQAGHWLPPEQLCSEDEPTVFRNQLCFEGGLCVLGQLRLFMIGGTYRR